MYKKVIGLLMVAVFLFSLTLQTVPAQDEFSRWSVDCQTGESVEIPDYANIAGTSVSKEGNSYVISVNVEGDNILNKWDSVPDTLLFQSMIVGDISTLPTPPMVEDSFMEGRVGNKQWITTRLPGENFGPLAEYTYDGEWRGEEVTTAQFSWSESDNGLTLNFKLSYSSIPTDYYFFGVVIREVVNNVDTALYYAHCHTYGIDLQTGQLQIPFTVSVEEPTSEEPTTEEPSPQPTEGYSHATIDVSTGKSVDPTGLPLRYAFTGNTEFTIEYNSDDGTCEVKFFDDSWKGPDEDGEQSLIYFQAQLFLNDPNGTKRTWNPENFDEDNIGNKKFTFTRTAPEAFIGSYGFLDAFSEWHEEETDAEFHISYDESKNSFSALLTRMSDIVTENLIGSPEPGDVYSPGLYFGILFHEGIDIGGIEHHYYDTYGIDPLTGNLQIPFTFTISTEEPTTEEPSPSNSLFDHPEYWALGIGIIAIISLIIAWRKNWLARIKLPF